MTAPTRPYAARLDVEYPERLDRVTTAFRIIWIVPIAVVLGALSAAAASSVTVITDTATSAWPADRPRPASSRVRPARLELAQLSPLPPQDSVSTNFTTWATGRQN